MKAVHARSIPVRQLSDSVSVKYIEPCWGALENVLNCLQELEDGEYLALNKVIPDQPIQRYEFIQCLEGNRLSVPIMLLTYSSGMSGNFYLINQWNRPFKTLLE